MKFLSKFFGPPSQDAFAKMLMKRMRRAGMEGLQYDAEKFSVRIGKDWVAFLGNAYAEYCRGDKQQREAVINTFMQAWSTQRHGIPDDFEDAKPDLMPLLRARSYYEVDVARAGNGAALPIPYEIVADSLCLALAYDLPKSMATVTEDQLEKWGVSLYEALEVAKQNLRERTESYGQIGSVYTMANGDSYDASRLVLTDWVQGLDLRGDPIAMVPNRETLLVTGSEDSDGLAALATIAVEAFQHERRISGIPLRFADGEWQEWTPPLDHKCLPEFDRLRVATRGGEYESQKVVLDKRHLETGRDVFVASYAALQEDATGRIKSYCTWARGVPSLLPKTDLIMMVVPQEDGAPKIIRRVSVPWDVAHERFGHLMQEEPDCYPSRYLVEAFPADGELVALEGAVAS